jgi:hypothetical protein
MNCNKRSTHNNPSLGRVQFSMKCLSVVAIYLGIHHGSNKPAKVESSFDKIWVLG